MGWFFEKVTLQQLIAELTKERLSIGPDRTEFIDICLTHAYVADTESFGVLWCVRERSESDERSIECYLIEFKDGLLGYKHLTEKCGPNHYSVPLSFLSMVPLEVYGGDEEWREAVFAYSKEGQQQ